MILFKGKHRKNLTACVIKFMQTVGADLHIRPKVPFCTNRTACAIKFTITNCRGGLTWGC